MSLAESLLFVNRLDPPHAKLSQGCMSLRDRVISIKLACPVARSAVRAVVGHGRLSWRAVRQPEQMIAVTMGDHNAFDPTGPNSGMEYLMLGCLSDITDPHGLNHDAMLPSWFGCLVDCHFASEHDKFHNDILLALVVCLALAQLHTQWLLPCIASSHLLVRQVIGIACAT